MNSDTSTVGKKWKLKDPKVLRIFFSSPFNGMEGEREELTRKYFPQFHHACNSHGMRFVAVDMRWGITAEAADNAQVVSICLRELDRSDVFVGFFGQRYGWHGKDDELLQKNFDNAVGRYSWLNDVRDKSVTEIEYLHGHLNHPGKLPACICFRDKAFDDANREKAVAEGNKRNINKFSAESEHSSKMMSTLIEKVTTTQSQLLGLDVKYENPHEGAKFMFESVWETCLQLIADAQTIELSPLQRDRACHDAYISSLTSVYVEGDDSINKLKSDDFTDVTGYLVHGPQGSGKSSLLAKLVKKLQAKDSEFQVVYHFIGTGPGTTSPENILQRIVAELEDIGKVHEPDNVDNDKKLSDIERKVNKTDIQDLYVKMQGEVERVISLGKNLVLILDGLNKVKSSSKTAKHLYWLPISVPKGVTLIASTVSSDKDTFDLLVTEKDFVEMEIQPLPLDTQAAICKELLMKSGKELSPHQLKRIVDADQTKNPRFLNIVLSEISIFGYFRYLNDKIDSLVNCNGIKDLLREVLLRMEQDYNVKDHPGLLVNEVLSVIAVSHQGLSETEICKMFNISSHIWSPFFFALENFLISHGGLLRFAFPEMLEAVEDRYLQSEKERLIAMTTLVDYFDNILQASDEDFDSAVNKRVASELPWIQLKMEDKEGLSETISDPKIFYHLDKKGTAELIDLWKDTQLSANDLCSMILRKFDLAVNNIYKYQAENPQESQKPPGYVLLPMLETANDFFSDICQHKERIKILKRIIRILDGIEGKIQEHVRKVERRNNQYFLATTYVDDTQYDMAKPLFESIQAECEEILQSTDNSSIQQTLAYVCNGIGVMYLRQFQFEEAKPLLTKSAAIHKVLGNELAVAASEVNIGICKMETSNVEEALEYFRTALQKYEKIYFGHLPLIIGNLLTNIALCHRKMDNLDLAEEMYNRSLKVKVNAVGPQHEVVATAYMNLGVVEMFRHNFAKMEEHTRKAKDIFEALDMKLEQNEMWQSLENLMIALCRQNKQEEALPIFMRVFSMLMRENIVSQGHKGCHREMMQYMLSCEMFKEVANFLEAYVISAKLREPSYFKILHHCDKQLAPDERPERPKEQSIEYALKEIWPGNNELTAYYVQNEVLPANNIELFIDLLNKMDEMNPDFLESTYEVGATWCDNANNFEALLKVAEAGLLKYPESHSLKVRLFDALRHLRRSEEAYKIMHEILEKEKDNQGLMLVCGQIAAQANDLSLCQELWEKAATMENEDLAEKAKNGLIAVDEALKAAKTEEKENTSD